VGRLCWPPTVKPLCIYGLLPDSARILPDSAGKSAASILHNLSVFTASFGLCRILPANLPTGANRGNGEQSSLHDGGGTEEPASCRILPGFCRILPDPAGKSAASIVHNPSVFTASCRVLPGSCRQSAASITQHPSVFTTPCRTLPDPAASGTIPGPAGDRAGHPVVAPIESAPCVRERLNSSHSRKKLYSAVLPPQSGLATCERRERPMNAS
jgi:hypothetical protein